MRDLDRINIMKKIIVFFVLILSLYLFGLLYFMNHFCFNTILNGVNVSLKSSGDAECTIRNFINNYEIRIIEINGNTEVISGRDIEMHYNSCIDLLDIIRIQKVFKFVNCVFKHKLYYVGKLYILVCMIL